MGFLSLLSTLFKNEAAPLIHENNHKSRASSRRTPTRKPRSPSSVILQNGRRAVLVKRNTIPLYKERGWRKSGERLVGYYRTQHGAYRGRIEKPFSKKPIFFICKPPRELLNGPHGPCFSEIAKNTFAIHWSRKPQDLNLGIMRIEQTITEALQCP